MKLNPLSPEEKRIIQDKGTEPPFSGEYNRFFQTGVFVCRQCGAPLFRSDSKFDSHCGWPSFDQEIPGAVKRSLDADGQRTEITCQRCGGHLGHVFVGEKLTPRDTRHCVNSLSLKFIPEEKIAKHKKSAYFGGGCFWCVEAAFKMIQGVTAAVSGYAGGHTDHPTYASVSTGRTGQAETVRVDFDPHQISYEALLSVFFSIHDPTTPDRQGADIGSQYRSIILFTDDRQKEAAEKFIAELEQEKIFPAPIVTQIQKLDKFYPAEEEHQDYYAKNPQAGYCQVVINPKLAKLKEKFGKIIRYL